VVYTMRQHIRHTLTIGAELRGSWLATVSGPSATTAGAMLLDKADKAAESDVGGCEVRFRGRCLLVNCWLILPEPAAVAAVPTHLAQRSHQLLCRAGPCSSKDSSHCITVPHDLHLQGAGIVGEGIVGCQHRHRSRVKQLHTSDRGVCCGAGQMYTRTHEANSSDFS
jgi:hypothetical protein